MKMKIRNFMESINEQVGKCSKKMEVKKSIVLV